MKLVLVTGMSGSGKAVALRTLEDAGFEAIDNIPLGLVPALAAGAGARHVALGVDIRSRDFSPDHFADIIRQIKTNPAVELRIVFLDCNDEVLHRRFTTTRRKHPLAVDRPVADGIRHERALIKGVRDIADMVIDTTDYEAADLRQVIATRLAREDTQLMVGVTSFSFKRGVPRDADMVFDVRFLKNPYYEPSLSEKTGLESEVGEYILTDRDFDAFFTRMTGLLLPLLPRYLEEGKHYLTIAIGCTGGQHRSVFVAQKLAAFLEQSHYNVTLRHRDMKIKE